MDEQPAVISGARLSRPSDDSLNKLPRSESQQERATVSAAGVCPPLNVTARGFHIRSVRIDNRTNQWLRVQEVNDFIPPYTTGVILPMRGAGAVNVYPMTPLGWGQVTPIAAEEYIITMYDRPQMLSPGISIRQGSVAAFYNAPPLTLVQAASAIGAAASDVASNIHVPATGPAWEFATIRFILATTATVGNRFPGIEVRDVSNNIILRKWFDAGVIITASLTRFLNWSKAVMPTGFTYSDAFQQLPESLIVPPGGRLRFIDGNDTPIDAADTVASVSVIKPQGF